MKIDLAKLAALLQSNDNYLIITHRSPDGDTTGCAAALCLGLRALGKAAYVLPDPEMGPLLLPYVRDLAPPADFAPHMTIAVDSATQQRLAANAPSHIDIAIDHHISHRPFADATYLGDTASCGELIYELLLALSVTLTTAMAEALYVAISTDTGCFRYGNTTPNCHIVAAALMAYDFDAAGVNSRFFEVKSCTRIAIEQAVYAGMELLCGGRVVVMTITQAAMAAIGAADTDADDLSALTRAVEGCDIGILLRERDGEVRISVRTTPHYDASAICARLGGGGHKQASGCTVKGSVAEARAAILDAVNQLYPICKG